jgi:hypothetical protein
MIGIVCMISGFQILSQQVKNPPPTTLTRVDTTKLQLQFKTDLRVDAVHSSRCLNCDLPGIDAFYMANILVDVSNYKVGGVGAAAESILTVTYYDLMAGKMETVTRELSRLNPYPANPWTLQRYTVVNHPVLVKKSTGVKAEIKPKSSQVMDPVPVNNVKIVKKCLVMVY